MSKLDEVVVSYRIFENSTEYLGVAQVTLPDIEFLTTTISGAGIAGEVEEVIKGHIKAMRTTINFNTYGDNALALTTPVDHTIDLREVQQARNMTAGKVELRKVKHIMTIKPVKVSIGKLETASPADANGEYTVSYYAQYVGGKKKIEIDPHVLKEVFEYEDKEYSEIVLDFGKLTGRDALEVEREMQAEGIGFVRNDAYDGGYQMITAAKASGIAKDVLLALPFRDCTVIKRETRKYLSRGYNELANSVGEKIQQFSGELGQIIDNELRAEGHTVVNGEALDTYYCLKLAAKATDTPEDEILNLPMNEFLNIKYAVRLFLLGLG